MLSASGWTFHCVTVPDFSVRSGDLFPQCLPVKRSGHGKEWPKGGVWINDVWENVLEGVGEGYFPAHFRRFAPHGVMDVFGVTLERRNDHTRPGPPRSAHTRK